MQDINSTIIIRESPLKLRVNWVKIRGGPIFRVQQKTNGHIRQAEDAMSRKERESLLLRGLFTQLVKHTIGI